MNKIKKGIIYALIAVFLFSTVGVGFKLAVSRIDSFSVAVMLGLLATLALFFYLIIAGKSSRIIPEFKKHYWFFLIAGVIGLGIQQITYLKGYQLLPASQVVVLFNSYPLLMVLISALFFRERMSFKSVLCVLIGFLGVYILISKGTLLKIDLTVGTLITFAAALSWALFSVLIKHKKFDVEIGMFFFNLFGVLFLAALIPLIPVNFQITLTEFAGLAYLGIFTMALAFVLWNQALHYAPTSLCSNIVLMAPLLSMLLIFLILKEPIALSQILGLVLIVSSVLLNINITKK